MYDRAPGWVLPPLPGLGKKEEELYEDVPLHGFRSPQSGLRSTRGYTRAARRAAQKEASSPKGRGREEEEGAGVGGSPPVETVSPHGQPAVRRCGEEGSTEIGPKRPICGGTAQGNVGATYRQIQRSSITLQTHTLKPHFESVQIVTHHSPSRFGPFVWLSERACRNDLIAVALNDPRMDRVALALSR